MGSRSRIRPLLFAAACCVLASCGLLSEPSVRLLTDRPELAAYVERYNVRQGDFRVEVQYREQPGQAVLDGEQADVVVGEWLASPQLLDRFESTADIVKPGRIEPSWFYAGLLSMGSKDNRPVLIPLSFDLPAVAFCQSSVPDDLPSMFMPLELMRSMSPGFNSTAKNGSASSLGFSPLWNLDFLILSSKLLGARFHAGRGGLPAWDTDGLARTLDYLRAWITSANGGKDRDKAFADKNLVQPYYKLLTAKKTLFALARFTDYFALPEDKRKDLDYRWLSSNGVIPVEDDVVFAGVLRSARNKRGAKAFLEWFFTLQNQRSFLEVAQSLRIGVFGVTDGFSSFKIINEKDMAQKYPILLGHVPLESLLEFPDTLPDNWVKVRDEVILPWISRATVGDDTADLSTRIDEWHAAAMKK